MNLLNLKHTNFLRTFSILTDCDYELVTDLRIVCHNGTLQSYQFLFSSMSPMLRRLFTSKLVMEDSGKRKDEVTLHLPDVDLETLERAVTIFTEGLVNVPNQDSFDKLLSCWNLLSIDCPTLDSLEVITQKEEMPQSRESQGQEHNDAVKEEIQHFVDYYDTDQSLKVRVVNDVSDEGNLEETVDTLNVEEGTKEDYIKSIQDDSPTKARNQSPSVKVVNDVSDIKVNLEENVDTWNLQEGTKEDYIKSIQDDSPTKSINQKVGILQCFGPNSTMKLARPIPMSLCGPSSSPGSPDIFPLNPHRRTSSGSHQLRGDGKVKIRKKTARDIQEASNRVKILQEVITRMRTSRKPLMSIPFKHMLTDLLEEGIIVSPGWTNIRDKAKHTKRQVSFNFVFLNKTNIFCLQLTHLCQDYRLTGTVDHKYCTEGTEADMKVALAEIIKLDTEYQDNVGVELPPGAVLYGSSNNDTDQFLKVKVNLEEYLDTLNEEEGTEEKNSKSIQDDSMKSRNQSHSVRVVNDVSDKVNLEENVDNWNLQEGTKEEYIKSIKDDSPTKFSILQCFGPNSTMKLARPIPMPPCNPSITPGSPDTFPLNPTRNLNRRTSSGSHQLRGEGKVKTRKKNARDVQDASNLVKILQEVIRRMKKSQTPLRSIKFKQVLTDLLEERKIIAIGWSSAAIKDKAHNTKSRVSSTFILSSFFMNELNIFFLQLSHLCREYRLTGTVDQKYCTEGTEADMEVALAEIIKLDTEYQDNVNVDLKLPPGALLLGSSL